MHIPVFTVIANLDAKNQTVWTLYKESTEIAKVRSNSYFSWRFNSPGKYYLTAETTDSFGNVFVTPTKQMFAEVFTRDEYIEMIEKELDRRKLALTE